MYHLVVEPSDITMDADLSYDLGGDSMTLYNIRYELHKEFGISYPYSVQEESEYVENEIHTVGDVVEFIKRKLYGAQETQTLQKSDVKNKPKKNSINEKVSKSNMVLFLVLSKCRKQR